MPITLDFAGKLVLVTGGGRGIGLAIVTALAKGESPSDCLAGADVALTYTSKDASSTAVSLSKEHGVRVEAFKCEVTSSAEVDETIERVEKAFGQQVDIGIANAGVSLWKGAHEHTDADFKHIFDVNVNGPYYLARALVRSWLSLPIREGEGSATLDVASLKGTNLGKQILFVSSISALVAMYPQPQCAYNASKGAVTMLAKSLAAEWAHIGVSVNSISPGYVSTDMITKSEDPKTKAYSAEWHRRTPVGRFASPEEVGEFVAVMVSSRQGGNGWMTGSDVVLDGGERNDAELVISR